jgi:hypothetical protein
MLFQTRSRMGYWAGVGTLLLAALATACGAFGEESPTRGETSAIAPSSGAAGGMPGVDSAGLALDAGHADSGSKGAPSVGGAPAPNGTTNEAYASEDILGRTIIRNGSLDLEVESVPDAYDRVSTIANAAGGYVQEGSFFGSGRVPVADSDSVIREERSARLVLRVPSDRYDEVVANLRGIAKDVRAIGMQTRDVTGEVTDLDATLRNLRAVEEQYVQLLGRAQSINDILLVQDKLRQVRLEIDRAESRRTVLSKLSDLATISVQLAPVPATPERVLDSRNPLHVAEAAWDASLDMLSVIAAVLVAVLVFSWWLVPFIALGTYAALRIMRMRRTTPATVEV